MSAPLRIGIIGDFEPTFRSHFATNAAVYDAAAKLKTTVEIRWLSTPSFASSAGRSIRGYDGLIASPGSPYRSFDGMLGGIRLARMRDVPFVGTCGGFQYALIEYARNVLKIADADSAENESVSAQNVIAPLSCALPNRQAGGPMGSGAEPLTIVSGSALASIYRAATVSEEYFCNYGVNDDYRQRFQAAGLRISATGASGEARAVELPDHRFFVATLFQPQLSSRPESPHPIFVAFLRAALRHRRTPVRRRTAARHRKARR